MLNRKESEAKLLEKASQDPAFKAALVADPKNTIERELGVKLPGSAKVHVLQEEANDYYLVLPLNPEGSAEGVIGDSQLEAVAGGGCYGDCGCDVHCDV